MGLSCWKLGKLWNRIVRCEWGQHLLTGRYKCFQDYIFSKNKKHHSRKSCSSLLTRFSRHQSKWDKCPNTVFDQPFYAWIFRWCSCHPTAADIFWFERWLKAAAFLSFAFASFSFPRMNPRGVIPSLWLHQKLICPKYLILAVYRQR